MREKKPFVVPAEITCYCLTTRRMSRLAAFQSLFHHPLKVVPGEPAVQSALKNGEDLAFTAGLPTVSGPLLLIEQAVSD